MQCVSYPVWHDNALFRLGAERTLGGLDVFLPYIKNYVETFMGKSITSQEWKHHLYAYYQTHGTEDNIKALDSIDWNVCHSSMSFVLAL